MKQTLKLQIPGNDKTVTETNLSESRKERHF